jgi:CheY-like chemotaxis protein
VPLKKPAPITKKPASKLILVGEDDMDDKEFFVEVFSDIDGSFYLEFVNNGRGVLNNLEKMGGQLPCLIVLDYNMPEMNASEILMELKRNKRYDSIPKVVWSTSGSDSYKSICLALGAKAYITKPTKVKEFEDIVKHLISLC